IDFRLHGRIQLSMKLLDLVEVPRERRNCIGDAQERQGERGTLALVRRERARATSAHPTGQQIRGAQGVGATAGGQWVFKIAGVATQRPTRSVALSEVARRSPKASQATDQCATLDICAQLRAARLQDLEKAAPDIPPKCGREPLSRNCGKDAVTG